MPETGGAGGARPKPQAPLDGNPATMGLLRDRIGHALARRMIFRTAPLRLARPVVSISFDDFPATAHETGAAMLEAAGARATFYAATGLLGAETPLWRVACRQAVVDLHRRGHEIGLHTHSHRPLYAMSARAFEADLAANRAFLRRLLPDLVHETFAYPYGIASYGPKRRLGRLVRAARGVQHGINAGRLDLDFIKAVELADRTLSGPELDRLLDETVRRCGWLVFLTHDIAPNPSRYGASPALLQSAVDGARRRGIAILPIRAALDAATIA